MRDLLQKTPHAAPRVLAQATGRKVELGQAMAQAIGRRRSSRSTRVVFALAGASYALLPLGPALGQPHRGDAAVSPAAPGTHTRPPSLALFSAARSRGGPPQRKPRLMEPGQPLEALPMAAQAVSCGSPPQSPQGQRKPGDRGVQFCGCRHLDRAVCASPPGLARTHRCTGYIGHPFRKSALLRR